MPQIILEGRIQLQVQGLTPSLGLAGPQDRDDEAYFIQKYDIPGEQSFSNFVPLLTPVSNAGSHSHPMHHSVEHALCVDRYINVCNVYGVHTQEGCAISDEFVAHFHLNARNNEDGTMIDLMASLLLNNQTATIGTLHQKIVRWFINCTASNQKSQKNVRQPMTPALLTFPGPPCNVHAKDIFATAHRTKITSAMNTRRITKGDFGIWLGKFEVQAHCRNQEHLENTLRAVFEGLIGHGNNQIGDAVVHCQFAYHAMGNMVKAFSVEPGLADSINCRPPHCLPLSDFVINYTDNVTWLFVEWANLCLKGHPEQAPIDEPQVPTDDMETNVPPELTQMTMNPPAPASALVLGPAMAHCTTTMAEPFPPKLELTFTDATVMPPTTEPPLAKSHQATVSPPLSPQEQPVVSQTAIIMTATHGGTQGEGARRMLVRNIKKRSVEINLTEGAGSSGGKGKRYDNGTHVMVPK
ncbi:hypothetical protein K439DRAFT_1611474 [Ramaria rubella]|nr:hypothetical protein K439DRAFT_1611474 [Ramaria rubella]